MAPRGVNVLMKVEGGEQLRRALKRQRERFFEEMRAGLDEESARLLGAAKSETPAASGTLLMSLTRSSSVQASKGRIRHAVAYTDPKAAAVHEGVHWGRKTAKPTRGFKWFERVLHAFEAGFVERIATRLRRLVGGG